jgi:hypothetical protein
MLQRIQTGRELNVSYIVLLQRLPDLPGMLCNLSGQGAKNIVLHMECIQQLHGMKAALKRPVSGSIDSGVVMALRQQIQGDPHKIFLFRKIPAPVLIQGCGIGLERIGNFDSLVPPIGDIGKFPEPLQSGKGRLAALKRKIHPIPGSELRLQILEHSAHLLQGHNAIISGIPPVGNIRIKAVFTPQIACCGCRLNHNGQLFHSGLLSKKSDVRICGLYG